MIQVVHNSVSDLSGRDTPPQPQKLLGMYPQRQDGLYMQRIPIFAGHISPSQLRGLAAIATEFTQNSPLHLTTRQDIELHNVPTEHLNTIQNKLQAIGLPTFGAGGDSVRNITLCPCCDFNPQAYNIRPLADLIREFLHNNDLLNNLPRKFKISFAGCGQPQSKPYVNDLSFIATSRTTVRVIGAGSLGPKPQTGIVLFETLPIEDVLPLTAAALKFFAEHGDRENRRKARFRHIRQRLGDSAFLDTLNSYFQKEKQSRTWPTVERRHLACAVSSAGWNHRIALQFVNGELDTQHTLLLANAAAEQDAQIRINLHHGIDLFSRKPFVLPNELRPLTDRPCIVACPGSTTCKNGLTNCPQLAAKLSDRLRGNEKLKGKTIALSGCPNNCAHSAIADIGLVGQIKTVDGKRQEVYQALLHGGNGITDILAQPVSIIPADRMVEFLEKQTAQFE
jgi:sulfite reductase beta subunit-like hemoprotein